MTIWRRLPLLLPWKRREAERDMRDELQSIAAIVSPRIGCGAPVVSRKQP